MANLAERFGRFRFVRKRSSTLQKLILLFAIVISSAALLMLDLFIKDEQAKEDAWREQAALEQQKNEDLNNRLEDLGSLAGVETLAQELLGLVHGNGIFFQPES